MDLRPALQIQTVIKALVDVVLPAVDPNNKLAQEQAKHGDRHAASGRPATDR